MKFLLISCVLWTISLADPPEGFTNLGNYGTTFANKFQFGIRHSAICGAAGLRTLSLDSAEEFEYFLALMMWTRSATAEWIIPCSGFLTIPCQTPTTIACTWTLTVLAIIIASWTDIGRIISVSRWDLEVSSSCSCELIHNTTLKK